MTANASDSVSIGLAAEPANLDFSRTEGAAIPQALLVNVYEGLVKLDQRGRIVPLLARSWTVSPDRRTRQANRADHRHSTVSGAPSHQPEICLVAASTATEVNRTAPPRRRAIAARRA